jgi:ubiquitin carboxyl-terminal hydrolase 36/42
MQCPGLRLTEVHFFSCDDKVTARKKLTIYKAPKSLTVHLKRFSFQDGHISKVDKMITYKEQLDIRPHMTEGQEKNVPGIYKLLAVIVHSGATTHSGHYVAYIKSSNGLWYCMNDTSVSLYDGHQYLLLQY